MSAAYAQRGGEGCPGGEDLSQRFLTFPDGLPIDFLRNQQGRLQVMIAGCCELLSVETDCQAPRSQSHEHKDAGIAVTLSAIIT